MELRGKHTMKAAGHVGEGSDALGDGARLAKETQFT
jgi:hypothetical protein